MNINSQNTDLFYLDLIFDLRLNTSGIPPSCFLPSCSLLGSLWIRLGSRRWQQIDPNTTRVRGELTLLKKRSYILALLNVKPLPFHSNLHINLNSNHWSHIFRCHKSSLSRACNKQRTPEAENQNSPTNSIHILNAAVYTRCWKEANTLFRLPYLHDKSVNLLYILRPLRPF